MRPLFLVLVVLGMSCGSSAPVLHAQELYDDVAETVRAVVVSVEGTEERLIPGTDTPHRYQTIRARVETGSQAGALVTIENDFLELAPGDRFLAIRHEDVGGFETYSVQDVDRRSSLVLLLFLFVFVVILFGGWYGARSLLSLIGSLLVLAYVLVPGILGGWDPLFASFVIASLILIGVLFLTHGVNRESVIAVGGTILAVLLTLIIAAWAVSFTSLSGYAASESVYLNFNTRGTLDLVGLLIGGIVIGALGVLDDVAITQVSVVRELLVGTRYTRREVFFHAMRVGREHVGAVVNTLALAYMGVSLPLVLLMHLSPTSTDLLFNMEVFATEIVRTVVGSIGIVATVPLVTLLAARYLVRQAATQEPGSVAHYHC